MDNSILAQAGIDYEQGTNRFAGNRTLYEHYLNKFFEDNEIEELDNKIKEGNIGAAYNTAHTLKGVTGNLSINKLYELIAILTDSLRQKKTLTVIERSHLETMMIKIHEAYDKAKAAVKA